MFKLNKQLQSGQAKIHGVCRQMWVKTVMNQKGGLGAIGGGIILLLVVGYVAYSNRSAVGTFFTNMWTYIETKIKTIF